jgi:hypothetical protein
MDSIGNRSSDKLLKLNALAEDFKSQSFSDCTVLSEAASPKGLHYLLVMVTQFALDLLQNGFLLRGGIAKGALHHSANAVFGPAFLDAYYLEQQIAKYPRIVVDRKTHKDFELNPSPETFDKFIKPDLRHDEDGPVYVDVFSSFRILDGQIPPRVTLTAQACRANIQEKLDNSIYIPAHYEKLRWLALYWNAVRQMQVTHGLEPIEFPINRDWKKHNNLNGGQL